MLYDCNPNGPTDGIKVPLKQTFEDRVADGSANIYLLLAGLIVSALDGVKRLDALDR